MRLIRVADKYYDLDRMARFYWVGDGVVMVQLRGRRGSVPVPQEYAAELAELVGKAPKMPSLARAMKPRP